MGNIRTTPTIEAYPSWSIDQEAATAEERYSALPTAADMRARALFGIPLRSAFTGQELSDETINHYVGAALTTLEHELDLYITPVKFKEKHDFQKEFWLKSYAYVKLFHPNVINVERVELSFSNADDTRIIEFPMEFVHIMPQEGALQLVPAFGSTFSGFLLSAFSGTQFHALRQMGVTDFPGGFRITYTAGFQDGKIPSSIVNLIENMAAYQLLSSMGPIMFPYNSVSVAIDGVSQGTSNMGPQFLSKRLEDLGKLIEDQKRAVKGYYQRAFLVDYV